MTAIEMDRKKLLFSILTVRSEVEPHALRWVFVNVPEGQSDDGEAEAP